MWSAISIVKYILLQSQPPLQIGEYYVLSCYDHIVTNGLIFYILILGSYVGGFFIFRFSETENLSSLSETVSKSGLLYHVVVILSL